MIAAQLLQLEPSTARGLCLQFILHEYVKALEMAARLTSCPDCEKLVSGLDRLCIYCEALIEISKKGEELLNELDELRMRAAQEQTSFLRRARSIGSNLSPSRSDFHKQLSLFFPLLIPHIEAAAACETALFSLLELRGALNAHLGMGTVEHLLQTLFPHGPLQMRQAISDGFSKRGFVDFCEQHHELFEEIVWPTLNPMPLL